MYTSEISKEVLRQDIASRIASISGLNNTSKSSTVSQIVDAVSGPLADVMNNYNGLLNSMYTELASGALLTANAYEFGVIRNTFSEVFVTNDDKNIKVKMSDNSPFPEYMAHNTVIKAGTEYSINNSSKIRVMQDVVVNPGDLELYISAKIVSPSGTDVPAGTSVSIDNKEFKITSGVSIVVERPISFRTLLEDDDELRKRVQLAKIKTHGSSEYSIAGWISSIPTVIDWKTRYNYGSAAYEVAIVTSNLKEYGVDPNSDSVIASARAKIDTYVGAESRVEIAYPKVYKMAFVCSYENSSDSIAMAGLADAFSRFYSFNDGKSIKMIDIKNMLIEYPGRILVDSIFIRSDKYGVLGSYKNDDTIEIPDDAYLILDTGNSFFTDRNKE